MAGPACVDQPAPLRSITPSPATSAHPLEAAAAPRPAPRVDASSPPTLLPDAQAEVAGPPLRPFTHLSADDRVTGLARVALAERNKRTVVESLFAEAGVAFPPAELLLRGFKAERELEVWASSEPGAAMRPIARYTICAASGDLGPKRREGDRQVPEGYYHASYLWPNSAFFLALKVSYPNVSDRRLGDRRMPGGDIMIHGGCASIGCLAMSDERIQEIYLMANATKARHDIAIHLYPTRDPQSLVDHEAYEEHRDFWRNLYEGHALFEATHRPPAVEVGVDGRYRYR